MFNRMTNYSEIPNSRCQIPRCETLDTHNKQTSSLHTETSNAPIPPRLSHCPSGTIVQYNLAHMHRPIQYTCTPRPRLQHPRGHLGSCQHLHTHPHTERLCVSRQYAHAHAIPISSPRRATSPSTWTPLSAAQYADTFQYTSVYASTHSVAPSRQYAHMHAVLITAQRGAARARSRPRRGRAPPRLGGAGGGGRGRRVVAEDEADAGAGR